MPLPRLFLIALVSFFVSAFAPRVEAQVYGLNLSADPTEASLGSPVTFTAFVFSVPSGDPINEGVVKFYTIDNSVQIPLGDPVDTVDGYSILSTSNLPLGTHTIQAIWYRTPIEPLTGDFAEVTIVEPGPPDSPGSFYLFTTVAPAPTPGEADVTIRRTGSLGAVTVNYATAAGTAVAGRDYTAASGVATFSSGQTDQTIHITLLAPAANGSTFNVQLSNPTGGATLGSPSSLTVTIANSTPPPPSPYIALANAAYTQAAAYFAAGDQANGYLSYASYEYYLYLLDPVANASHLSGYYQDMAYGYYISYTEAGDPAAALAWYNYYVGFI